MKIVVDLIVTIAARKLNGPAIFVTAQVVGNAPDIWNAKIATKVIATVALRRQVLMKCIYVKIVVESNAFNAVCVGLTLPAAAARVASILSLSLG